MLLPSRQRYRPNLAEPQALATASQRRSTEVLHCQTLRLSSVTASAARASWCRHGRAVSPPDRRARPPKAVPASSPGVMQLVSAAAVPVAKIALFCAVGSWASGRGLLTPDGRRVLSSLTLNIFTPCLLFSKLAVGVGLQDVARLWVLSANMVASHVIGLLLGLLAVRAAQVPYRLRNQLVISCGVGNVGNLPFVLLAGLAVDPALPFAAALGPAMAGELAMRYVALSNLSAALIQFPLTYFFLQKPAASPTPSQPALFKADSLPTNTQSGKGTMTTGSPATSATPPTASPAGAASVASAMPPTRRWQSLAAGIFTPPTVLSLAAVGVASVGWLREALFAPNGCLRLLGEVVDALGDVCIPVLLLVLGANLSRGPGVAAGRLPASCALAAVATRLVLLPAVCSAALLGAARAGLLPGTDPLAMLVMLVMHATPTAVLVHSMATIFGNAEDEVAALLFWQYVASLVTLPLAICAMLHVLGPAASAREAWVGSAAWSAAAGAATAAAA